MPSKRKIESSKKEHDSKDNVTEACPSNGKKPRREILEKSQVEHGAITSNNDIFSQMNRGEHSLSEKDKIALVLSAPKKYFGNVLSDEDSLKIKNQLDDAELEETLFGSSENRINGSIKQEDEISEIFEACDENEKLNRISNHSNQKANNDESTSASLEDLFSPDETVSDTGNNKITSKTDSKNVYSNGKEHKISVAKKKLSKWAARLFDPDRPRGLVEAPQIIPLNDEFLQSFGKREKEFFDSVGKPLEIDRGKITDANLADESDEDAIAFADINSKDSHKGFKVKITNLAYVTTLANLTKKMQEFGATLEVNLIMDESGKMRNNVPLSIGKAYVTFPSLDSANTCCEKLNEKPFEGRMLRVALFSEKNPKRRSSGGKEVFANSLSRYWERDITTKCYRCGEIGHIREQCPNAEKPRPCPICTLSGHDLWKCPIANHCFNCGIPGHVSRDCPFGRGLPNRVVCTICFTSGHHRWQCQINPIHIVADNAICFTCGKRGHVCCKDMRWSFGLNGVFCFNCGMKGHHGTDCKRPNFDRCNRNQEIASAEIERAKHWTEASTLATRELDKAFDGQSSEQNYQRGRSKAASNGSFRPRAKSQPAHSRGYRQDHNKNNYNNTPTRGYNKNYQHSPSPSQPRRGYQGTQQYNQSQYRGNRGYN